MSSQYIKYKDLGDKNEIVNVEQSNSETESELEKIESLEHKNWLIKNNKVVLVDIYGDWCGPCKAVEPRYKQLAQQYSRRGECAVVKEDVDNKFSQGIRGVPTFQFFFKGRSVGVVTGGDIASVEKKLVQLLQQP